MRRGERGVEVDEVEGGCRGVLVGVVSVAGQSRSSTPTSFGSLKSTLVQSTTFLFICRSWRFRVNRIDIAATKAVVLEPSRLQTLGRLARPHT